MMSVGFEISLPVLKGGHLEGNLSPDFPGGRTGANGWEFQESTFLHHSISVDIDRSS